MRVNDHGWDSPTPCRACGDGHPPGTLLCPVAEEPVQHGPCGTTVDRYAVLRRIGGGGMGAVYRARHTVLDQDVALKILHPRLAARHEVIERFVREARTAAALRDPRIVQVYDSGVTPDGTAFLAMELLQGEPLEALVERESPMQPGRAVPLVAEVLEVLALAHDRGVVHRDLKPANVFVLRDAAGQESVKLLDFGISKTVDAVEGVSLTQTGVLLGTPVYMAPEQVTNAKNIDRRADLYAAGVMLYEMLSGRLPHTGQHTAEILVRLMTEAPTPLATVAPGTNPALCAVVERAMARDPAGRFDDARSFAAALRAAVSAADPDPGRTAAGLAATMAAPVYPGPGEGVVPRTVGGAVGATREVPGGVGMAPWSGQGSTVLTGPSPGPGAGPEKATKGLGRRQIVLLAAVVAASLALSMLGYGVLRMLADDDDDDTSRRRGLPAQTSPPAQGTPRPAGGPQPAMAPMGPPRTQEPPPSPLPDLF